MPANRLATLKGSEILRIGARAAEIGKEVCEHIVYDDFPLVTPAVLEPRVRSRCLIVNGVSKAYAMTGWRIG